MGKSNFNKEQYYDSVQKLDSIFRGMSETINENSKWRCPYKNVENRCTAKFGCRNQDRDVNKDELYICAGSDSLNYRFAWDI